MTDPGERRTPTPMMAALVGAVSLNPVGQTILTAVLAALATDLGEDYGRVQLTLTVYLLATAPAQLVYGPLSDRFGRRPPLLAGIALFALASLAAAFATSVDQLLVCRALQAVGGCAGFVLGRTIVRDLSAGPRAASALGFLTTISVLVPMLAPLVGGLLYAAGRGPGLFAALALWAAAILALAALLVPETNPAHRNDSGHMAGRHLAVLRSAGFRRNTGIVCLTTSSYYGFLAGAPHVATVLLGRTPTQFGLLFFLIGGGYSVGNLATGVLAQRLKGNQLLAVGSAITVAATATLWLAFVLDALSVPLVFGSMAAVTIGQGLVLPISVTRVIGAVPGMFGTASSLSGCLQTALGALVTVVVGAWVAEFPQILGLTSFVTCALSAVLAAQVITADRRAG